MAKKRKKRKRKEKGRGRRKGERREREGEGRGHFMGAREAGSSTGSIVKAGAGSVARHQYRHESI